MIGVFANAFYYIALLNPKDQSHRAALGVTSTIRRPIITTTWVMVEVADAFHLPPKRRWAHHFLERSATETNTQIILAHRYWFDRGMTLHGARPDKDWSLTDWISFAVMAELRLTDALTGDHHFEQAGFRALLRPA